MADLILVIIVVAVFFLVLAFLAWAARNDPGPGLTTIDCDEPVCKRGFVSGRIHYCKFHSNR